MAKQANLWNPATVTANPQVAGGQITIRSARVADAAAIERVALLDGGLPLAGSALVATVDGQIVAVLSLLDGRAVADPFRPTAEVVDLLRLRAYQVARSRRLPGRRHALPRLRLRPAS